MGYRDALFVLLALLPAGAALLAPVSNPDLGWHLSAGRFILSTLSLPRSDFLTWTLQGEPWVDFEWLAQVLYWPLYAALGLPGLLALKTALLAAVLLVVERRLASYGLGARARALGVLVLSLALFPNADVRPENFSLLLFAATLSYLEALRLGEARPGPGHAAAAFALYWLWAGLHAGFLLGLAAGGVYLAAAPRRRALLGVLSAASAATVLTPYGWGVHRVALEHRAGLVELSRHLWEWAPSEVTSPVQWPYWGLLASYFVLALASILRGRRVPYQHLALAALLALASAAHARLTGFFCVLAVPALSALAAGGRLKAPLAWGLLAALWAHFAGVLWPVVAGLRPAAPALRAEGACRFLRSESGTLSALRMYNPPELGGALGLCLHPAYRVLADGRYLFHPWLPRLRAALADADSWRSFLADEGIGLALLPRRQGTRFVLERTLRDGRRLLLSRPFYAGAMPRADWALAYWDEDLVLLVSRRAVPAAWLERREYRALRADDFDALLYLADRGRVPRGRVESELARFREEVGGREAAALEERVKMLYSPSTETRR